MRISSNLFFKTGLNSINAQQSDLVHLYKQVGSGKRMVSPSDDPLAAAQAINVSQTLAMSERYAANRQVANRNLGMQDNVLGSVTLQLQDIKTRLVEAGNGTWSANDRATMADVLETARAGLLNLANSTDGNGQYLFSGAKGRTAAFTEEGVYQGSDHARLIQVDQTRQIDSADIGSSIFSRAAPGTAGYVTIPGNNSGTAAVSGYSMTNSSGLANGRPVEISFSDNAGVAQYTVTIPTEGGAPLSYTRDLPAASANGEFKLVDQDLGVSVTLTGTPQAGDAFELVPLHTSSYSVEGPASGPAIRSVSGYEGQSLTLTYDSSVVPPVFTDAAGNTHAATVDTSTTPPRLTVDVNGMETVFEGVPANGDTFTIAPGAGSQSREELNLFAALDDMISALRAPDTGAASATNLRNSLNSAMQRVDAVYNNVLSVRASSGTRMNEIDALQQNGSTRIMEYKNQLSQLEDLDYYTAITQLTLRTTALEAAAQAFQKIQNTSLFNMGGG